MAFLPFCRPAQRSVAPFPSPHLLSLTLSAYLSREVNELQNLECANGQIEEEAQRDSSSFLRTNSIHNSFSHFKIYNVLLNFQNVLHSGMGWISCEGFQSNAEPGRDRCDSAWPAQELFHPLRRNRTHFC